MCRYILLFFTCSLLVHLYDAIPRAVDNMKPTAEDMFFHLNTPQEEFKVPDLPFNFNEMEPIIDAATMEIHHSVIFKEHTAKLNEVISKWKKSGHKSTHLLNNSLVDIWRKRMEMPMELVKDFSNYAGAYINHILYFSTMTPNPTDKDRTPSKDFSELIEKSFHNYTEMKKDLHLISQEIFGCGWVYLARATGYSSGEYLTVLSSLEEMAPLDNPKAYPILALDLWEHAYFKKYGSRRNEYEDNWWKTVDWVKVERLLNFWRIIDPSPPTVHVDL